MQESQDMHSGEYINARMHLLVALFRDTPYISARANARPTYGHAAYQSPQRTSTRAAY